VGEPAGDFVGQYLVVGRLTALPFKLVHQAYDLLCGAKSAKESF
jgi:hypothetical protein